LSNHGRCAFGTGWSRKGSHRDVPKIFLNLRDSRVLCKLGEAFTRIEAWDDAITSLEKSVTISAALEFEVNWNEIQSELHQVLGQTYLEQYYSDESLVAIIS